MTAGRIFGRRLSCRLAGAGVGAFLLASCNGPLMAPPAPSAAPASLSERGEALAEIELANRLVSGRGVRADPAAGAALVESLAEGGNPLAQTIIGEYYLTGIGVERKPEIAASWMQKAAAQNFAWAEAELAYLYLRGLGVPQDYQRGMQLARSAADRGQIEGDDVMGEIYANGWGVGVDTGAALRWLHKAADHRYWAAMLHLGEVYRDGKGVPPDPVVAYAWFDLALANSHVEIGRVASARARNDVGLMLLPADLALARRLATEWKPGDDLATLRAKGVSTAAADAVSAPATDSAPTTLGNAPPADLPLVIKQLTYSDDVHADGSVVSIMHLEIQPRNDAAAKEAGQQPLRYSASLETVEVQEAYTLKPDGRKLRVNPTGIQSQLAPGAPDLPMFDDQRQKVIIFPSVEAGDVLVITAKYVRKPIIPGFFSMSAPFDRTAPYNDVRITVTVPKSMPLTVETHEMKFEQHSDGDKLVYQWRYANPNPLPDKVQALDDHDVAPRVFISTFGSYDQLARAYAALADAKGAVTPAIRQRADEITKGVSDPRQQAALIYGWVSRHIRYVALELGREAIVPHAADTVLANGYGDCKDHAVLFSALLKAKGIASNTVLINLGTSYELAGPPTFGTLNHAITYLPQFKLYADTTAGVAPFGVLPFEEYGKPVVMIGAAAGAVQRTPVLPSNAASISFKTDARLDKDGKIEGDSEAAATGPFSVALRQDAVSIEAAGPEQAARYYLRSKGHEGAGRFEFASPYEVAGRYRIGGHFTLNPQPELLAGNSFYLPTGLDLGARPGDLLMGSLTFRDVQGVAPTPCFSGRQEETLSLELPDGRRLRELPKGATVDNPYMHYKSEWSLAGRTVTVHRVFSSTIDRPLCIGAVRREVAQALAQIRADYAKPIALAPQ